VTEGEGDGLRLTHRRLGKRDQWEEEKPISSGNHLDGNKIIMRMKKGHSLNSVSRTKKTCTSPSDRLLEKKEDHAIVVVVWLVVGKKTTL